MILLNGRPVLIPINRAEPGDDYYIWQLMSSAGRTDFYFCKYVRNSIWTVGSMKRVKKGLGME